VPSLGNPFPLVNSGAALYTRVMVPLLLALLAAPVPVESRQMLLVTSPDWNASRGLARRYERSGPRAAWMPKGDAFPVSLGKAGLAWGRGLHAEDQPGLRKREGDGRAPAGVFPLREALGYAAAGPQVRLPYRVATDTLRCVDDPASAAYNTLREDSAARDWTSAEDMRRTDDLYRWVVWVGHNDEPPQPGGGSCIFLHLRGSADATTAGCTAFDEPPMAALLAWLSPAERPVLVQLPESERRRLSEAWGLPRE
jgi:L,D-peptidoglycan transpeptidase YkuD (ErfK/YbiS/YcfS/YnhG family)